MNQEVFHVKGLAFLFLLTLAVCISGCSGGGSGSKLEEFSADQVIETPGGQTMTQKVYHAPGKVRIEQQTPGGTMITIMRFDKGVTWMIYPGGNYMEMPASSETAPGVTPGDMRGLTKKGTKEIDGIECTVYQLDDGQGTVCVAEGAMLAIETVGADGTTIRLKGIQKGKQDPALFELPPGAKKLSMPAGIPIPGM